MSGRAAASAVVSEGDEAYPDEVAREGSIGPMSEAEYLEYDRTHEGKHERIDGVVVAMSGVSDAHDRIEVNTITALASRLGRGPCRLRG